MLSGRGSVEEPGAACVENSGELILQAFCAPGLKKINATIVNLAILRYQRSSNYGWVAEWSIAHAWKACIPKGIGGSNPPPSASIVFMLDQRVEFLGVTAGGSYRGCVLK